MWCQAEAGEEPRFPDSQPAALSLPQPLSGLGSGCILLRMAPLPLPIPVLRFSGMFLEVSKEINVS